MQALRKKLGKHKRRILRMMKGLPPKYQAYNKIIRHFVTTPTPVIFDVGAHIGESIERFKEIYPASRLYSFEADGENFQKLQSLHGKTYGVTLNNFAAGSEAGVKTFYRNIKSDTSSFNRINPESEWAKLRSRQHNVNPAQFTQKSYEVTLKTLDSYIAEAGIDQIDILKIDTQGFEDEVLKGAENFLKADKIKLIEVELIVGDLYEKSLSFYDIEKMLIPCGYRFYAIDASGNLMANSSLAFNIIYVHSSLLGKS